MKPNFRVLAGAMGVVVGVAAIVGGRPLIAQPKPELPYSPTGAKAAQELVVQPGVYTSFVFAYDADAAARARLSLKTQTGELIVVVRGGETVVVPMSPNWILSQQGTLKIPEHVSTTSISATGITPSGPVNFEAAKK